MKVKVEGFAELDRQLGEFKKLTAVKLANRALMAAAAPIQQDAEAGASARPGAAPKKFYTTRSGQKRERRPGTLKHLMGAGTKLTRRQAAGVRKAGKDFAEVYVGTRDPVGLLGEFGTKDAAPNPALRRAWEANKDRAVEIIKAALTTELEQQQARAAARRPKRARK